MEESQWEQIENKCVRTKSQKLCDIVFFAHKNEHSVGLSREFINCF